MPFEIVDRTLLQEHVIITQTKDYEIKALTLNGLTGFIQHDRIIAIRKIQFIFYPGKSKESKTFTKPNESSSLPSSYEYPSIKILNNNIDVLLDGKAIQVMAIQSPIRSKEIIEHLETKIPTELRLELKLKLEGVNGGVGVGIGDSGRTDLPGYIITEIQSFITNFLNQPPQNENSTCEEIQRFYENIRYQFEAQIGSTEELIDANEKEIDEFMNLVEKFVCTALYEHIQDENLESQIAALNLLGLNLSHLGVKITNHQEYIDFTVKLAGTELQSLDKKKSPYEKLDNIVQCHRVIVDALENRLMNGKHDGGDPNADAILPLLIYIVVKSNPKKLVSNLRFMQRFRIRNFLRGESSYCHTNINVDYKGLGLSPDKVFSRNVGQELADSSLKVITGVMDTSYKMIGRSNKVINNEKTIHEKMAPPIQRFLDCPNEEFRVSDVPVNRVLFVRNLPFNITSEEMYDIFGKYGAIRQIRLGSDKETRGTAFVVYEDIFDAKAACDHLNGFNVMGRYLIVLYYQPNKVTKKMNLQKKEEELKELKSRYGISDSD
ncbi:8817_t:CDS:10 [Diversispora eburnea]|uniref:8817_t:CDS:1 n=1 Tax=Diversispora eburnea TaxID=1213867 RepID=A0A9N9C8K5_9GLOM|nr:8817_t:CDS:10 [Diversispora eburnea]